MQKNNTRGFTLVEIAASLVALGAFVLAIMNSNLIAFNGHKYASFIYKLNMVEDDLIYYLSAQDSGGNNCQALLTSNDKNFSNYSNFKKGSSLSSFRGRTFTNLSVFNSFLLQYRYNDYLQVISARVYGSQLFTNSGMVSLTPGTSSPLGQTVQGVLEVKFKDLSDKTRQSLHDLYIPFYVNLDSSNLAVTCSANAMAVQQQNRACQDLGGVMAGASGCMFPIFSDCLDSRTRSPSDPYCIFSFVYKTLSPKYVSPAAILAFKNL